MQNAPGYWVYYISVKNTHVHVCYMKFEIPNCLVVLYMNDQNKIRMFMLEFHVRSISPLHSNDFQLQCSSYMFIGLHKLRTSYAFPLSINLSLVKY